MNEHSYICGPRISMHALPLDDELVFLFETRIYYYYYFIILFLFLENDLESPLIFVLFLKGKQNKKENPKCDSLFGKDGL